MLYLNDLPTEADGRIAKTTPRRSATGEISWDVDVAFEIDNEEDAKSADEFVPGAHQAWVAGQSGGKGVVKSSGPSELMRVAFSVDGEQIASGHADLRNATVTVNGSEATLCTRFRIHGMLPNAACELVYRLDEIILLGVEAHQLSIFDPQGEPVIESPKEAVQAAVAISMGYDSLPGTPETADEDDPDEADPDEADPNEDDEWLKGRLVVVGLGKDGEDQVAGIVMDELTDNELVVQEMGGSPVTVKASKIHSEMMLIANPGFDIDKVKEHYTELSKLAGINPDWADIIESIGLLYAENELAPTDKEYWPLTTPVLRRAIEVGATRSREQ